MRLSTRLRPLLGLSVVTALVGSLSVMAPVTVHAADPSAPPPVYTAEQIANYHTIINATWLGMIDTSPEALAATQPDPSDPTDEANDPSVRELLENHVIAGLVAPADKSKAIADWFSGVTPAATKVRAIHDWVANNMYYFDNRTTPPSAEPDRGGFSGALGSIFQFNKYGVMTGLCVHYARLAETLLLASGIPTLFVAGADGTDPTPFIAMYQAAGGTESSAEKLNRPMYSLDLHQSLTLHRENHARNLVYLDGGWKFLDATWDSRHYYTAQNTTDYTDPANWLAFSSVDTYYLTSGDDRFWIVSEPYVVTGFPSSAEAKWAGRAVNVTWSPTQYADGYVILRIPTGTTDPFSEAVFVGRVTSPSVTSLTFSDTTPRDRTWDYQLCPTKGGVMDPYSCRNVWTTPELIAPSVITVDQGGTATAQLTAAPGVALSATKDSGPDWFTVSPTGTIILTPNLDTPPDTYEVFFSAQCVPDRCYMSGVIDFTQRVDVVVTEPVIAIAPDDAIVPTRGGTATFQVKARDGAWTMSGQPSWVHPSVTSGEKGTTSVTLTVDPLTGGASRYTTITLTAGSSSVTYTLDQTDATEFSVTMDRILRLLSGFLARLLDLLSKFTFTLGGYVG